MKNLMFRPLAFLVTAITGTAIYSLLSLDAVAPVLCELAENNKEISSILSSYAFTVAGFLATIATFLFALADKPYFKFYKKNQSFGDLMFIHVLTLGVLAALFVLSILLLSRPALLLWSFALTVLSLLQLATITIISYKLTSRTNPS